MGWPGSLSESSVGDAPYTPLVIGKVLDPRLVGLPNSSLRIPLPSFLSREKGPVLVEDLLELVERAVPAYLRNGNPPVVAVTSRPLATRECASLLGFSEKRRRLAVVSVAGLVPRHQGETGNLGSPRDPSVYARARRRFQNLTAHELGHIRGLAHCSSPACVMNPVRFPHELDHRRSLSCGHCPRLRWWTSWKEILFSPAAPPRGVAEAREP